MRCDDLGAGRGQHGPHSVAESLRSALRALREHTPVRERLDRAGAGASPEPGRPGPIGARIGAQLDPIIR
jgi:hypothetical protein